MDLGHPGLFQQLRKQHQLSREKLAARAGLTSATITSLELRGVENVTVRSLLKVAKALDVTLTVTCKEGRWNG